MQNKKVNTDLVNKNTVIDNADESQSNDDSSFESASDEALKTQDESEIKSEWQQDKSDNKQASKSLSMSNDEVMQALESLEKTKDENFRLKDELLRGRAEMENTKKRLMKHYDELSKEKTKRLLLDIIGLLDDFERAFEAANSSVANEDQSSPLLEGIKMIESRFIQTLENKWGVVRFNASEEDFNPERHEAMMSEVRDDLESPIISEEYSKGYLYNEKILRPAKVKVAVPNK